MKIYTKDEIVKLVNFNFDEEEESDWQFSFIDNIVDYRLPNILLIDCERYYEVYRKAIKGSKYYFICYNYSANKLRRNDGI